jgi:hypothetical protein
MRGNSKRFSSKNPVFMIGETKHNNHVSNFKIIAHCRSYPLALCARQVKNETAIAYKTCTDHAVKKVKRCNERRQKKKE